MPSILLTGSTGFIGSHVLDRLLDLKRYDLIALTRKKKKSVNSLKIFEGNIGNASLINELVCKADYIIHMAGCKNDAKLLFDTNVKGTQNIINACKLSSRFRKIIYLSSVGVIGKTEELIIDENTVCSPNNEYEKSKFQAELIVKTFSKENPGKAVILRPTNVFGENDPEKHLLNLIRRITKNQFYFIGKNTSNYFLNYLYVKELSEIIPQLIHHEYMEDLYIVNTPTLLPQFIHCIYKILGNEKPITHLPFWPIKLAANLFDFIPTSILKHPPINLIKLSELTNKKQYSSRLLSKVTNWEPIFSMEEALSNLVDYYKINSMI